MLYSKRKDVGRIDASMGENDRFLARMEEQAVRLLEDVLLRRRWTVNERDKVAAFLRLVVVDEDKRKKPGRQSAPDPSPLIGEQHD